MGGGRRTLARSTYVTETLHHYSLHGECHRSNPNPTPTLSTLIQMGKRELTHSRDQLTK
ncbi:hypothetical protein L914_19138 [Phytophthora nicotianae]|uniref:Uncharacterized protein n=1 Tax=Phytophthora nicotianae TaxID=4792 RepID=W2MDR6_PHYNI|nr:hypothetical protein L914_19138 [Phytophthora nicotianae]